MSLQKKRKRIRMIMLLCGLLLGCYYLLPLVGFALDEATANAFMTTGLLYCAFPLYLYVSSVLLGIKHGFCSVYAVAAAVLFLPTLLIYFTASAWTASLIYGGIALVGNVMGFGVHTILKKMKETE